MSLKKSMRRRLAGNNVQLNVKNKSKLFKKTLLFTSVFSMFPLLADQAFAQQRTVLNGGFEEFTPPYAGPGPGGFTIRTSNDFVGWESTGGDAPPSTAEVIELWGSGHAGVDSQGGSAHHVELNPTTPVTLFQNVCVTNGETIRWSFWHQARNGGANPQSTFYELGDSSGNSIQRLATQVSNIGDGWQNNSGSAVYTGPTGVQRLQFGTDDPGAFGNFIDNVSISLSAYTEFVELSGSDMEESGGNLPSIVVSGVLDNATTLSFAITGGTATQGSDFTVTTTSITIPAGQYDSTLASSRFPLPITITPDTIPEADETIEIELTAVSSTELEIASIECAPPARRAFVYTIFDNDVLPTATRDDGTGQAGTASTPINNVTANDTINGQAVVLGAGGNATVSEVGTWPTGFSLNPDGSVDMDASVLPGTYTVEYELCDINTPATCVTASIEIVVSGEPEISIDKPAPTNADEDGSGTVSLGDTLTYTITATNDGNIPLTDVIVSDPLLAAPNDTTTCPSVAVGATCVLSGTYVVTAADVAAGNINNTANVVSDEITTPVEVAQTTAVAAFVSDPSLSMTKVADSNGAYAPGEVVLYTYTVENDGNVDINDVTLSDSHNGSAPLGDITISTLTNTSGQSSDDGVDVVVDVLAPGDVVEFTAEYVVTATDLILGGPVTNTATVTGTPDGGSLTPATANETITVTGTPRPDLTPGVCGGYVREGFLVDPGVPATEVNADFGSGFSGPTPFDPYVIAPFIGRNQSTGVVSFYQASADASDSGSFLSNGVVLNGPSGLTSTLVTAADHTSELWRAAARLEGAPGTTQTITINTGNAHEHTAYWQTDVNGALINTNSSSNAGNDDGWLFGTSPTFAGGDGASYTIDVTYPADGIVIIQFALLDSTGGFGGIIFDDYECPAPSISITKVADSTGPHKPGDTVTYTYTILNDGNQNVNDITVTDSHNGSDPAPTPGSETLITDAAPAGDSTDAGVNGSWDVLAPGDAFTFTGTYVITNDDVVTAADITNTATVTGTPVAGALPTTPITADEVVSVTPLVTDLSITKTNTPGVNNEVDQSGDTLTSGATTEYTLTVTNNGPDSVQGAVVTDIVGAGLTCDATNIVTISGDGVPAGSFTIGDLTGAGITLETLADGEAATLTYTCEVN